MLCVVTDVKCLVELLNCPKLYHVLWKIRSRLNHPLQEILVRWLLKLISCVLLFLLAWMYCRFLFQVIHLWEWENNLNLQLGSSQITKADISHFFEYYLYTVTVIHDCTLYSHLRWHVMYKCSGHIELIHGYIYIHITQIHNWHANCWACLGNNNSEVDMIIELHTLATTCKGWKFIKSVGTRLVQE